LSGDTFKSIIITETGSDCNFGLVECPDIQTVQKRVNLSSPDSHWYLQCLRKRQVADFHEEMEKA